MDAPAASPRSSTLIAVSRGLAALLGVVAIVATFADTASRATINPFNFFGYFTIQSNIILAIVLAVSAFRAARGGHQTPPLVLARACATTYIVLVGIVYNTLLVGVEGGGGVALGWANALLHVVLPIYALVDWIVFTDRAPLAWRTLPVSLGFPIVWLLVVLIRGATDGWVPYPFLNPANGYPSVAVYAVIIAVATIVTAAVVWAIGRARHSRA